MQRLRLEHRIPLFGSALLVVLLCVGAVLAYREVRAAATSAQLDRMNRVALQVAAQLGESWNERAAQLAALAANVAVSDLLRGTIEPTQPEAAALVQTLRAGGESGAVMAIVGPGSTIVTTSGAEYRNGGPPSWEELSGWVGDLHVSEFTAGNGGAFYWLSVPATLARGEEVYLSQLRPLTVGSAQLFQDLVGEDAAIFFSRAGSGVWAEPGASAIPAPSRVSIDGFRFDYRRDGVRRIATAHRIADSDLRLVVEQPYAAMLRRANVFAGRFGAVGLFLIGIGVLLMAVFARRLLHPITELAAASQDIARGEYERRVVVDRDDEIGELARAFNRMAGDIESTISDAQYSQAAALRANRAKSAFLANMSHEIRTPINAIVGYAELLREGISGELTPGQWRYVDRILHTSVHLTGLVDEVLDTAKIESGELRISSETFPAPFAVRGAVTVLAPQAQQRGVELTADCEEVLFRGDPQRVEQILVNLVSNAVKFTDPGGKVSVRGYAAGRGPTGSGALCCFDVTDTGPGIPPEAQAKIFQPFVQLDEGYARTRTGAGLGLAISQKLARLMGGDITLRSEVGKGSTFTVTLPAASSLAHHVEGDRASAYH